MNVSFYAGFGTDGLEALRRTNMYLKENNSDIPLIADCKRSEMGESVRMVEKEIFEWLHFDCVMVTPWFGYDTVRDYLTNETHGVCVYVHDSNLSAKEFQDLLLRSGKRLYEVVTDHVARLWNKNGNIFVECGATYPKQLRRVRTIIGPDMIMLVAGVGIQGGKVEDLRGVFGTKGLRLLVNSSRRVIFPPHVVSRSSDYFLNVRNEALLLRDKLRMLSQQMG